MRRVDLMRLHHHYVFCAMVLSLLAEALHKFPPQFTSEGGEQLKCAKGGGNGEQTGGRGGKLFLGCFFISLFFHYFAVGCRFVDFFKMQM